MTEGSWLGLRHVALVVSDVERSRQFYCDLFGYRVEWEPDADNVYLTTGVDNIALHRGDAGESGRLDHIGFCVRAADDVDRWRHRAGEHGATIVHELKTHRDGARSFYLEDPDGIVIQVIHHPPLEHLSGVPDPRGDD